MKIAKYVGLLGVAFGASVALANAGSVNVNEADAEALEALNGVGPTTAMAIVEEREANGPFERIEDLTRVRGIGEVTLEEMREQITLE